MSFKLGDKIYKEILYFYAEDLSTELPLYVLTQLSEATVEITADSNDVTDKNGNLVKKIWKSKSGTFSATNAFCNMNILEAASGGKAVFATSSDKVQMPKMFHVAAGTKTVDIGADFVEGSVKVAQYFADGSIGKTYELNTTASATQFAVAKETHTLTLPTDGEADMYFVKYIREASTGAVITNKADEFPSSVRGIMKATYYNPCKKNELKADYIEFPSFQVSPEVSFPINADSATMDFKGDLEIDYCGTDKVLYKVYDADEVDNM